MDGRIRVLVADDEPALRDALSDLIASDATLELVGAARDAQETITLAEATAPNVALVDIRMPGGGGLRVAEELKVRLPETRILAHTAIDDRSTVVRMLQRGAVGYIMKGTTPAEVLTAIHRAARGQPSVSPEVMSGLVGELGEQLRREEAETSQRLSRVERILRFIDGHGRTVVYQPIVELEGHVLVGMEALARFETDGPELPVERWFQEAAEVGLGTELALASVRSALIDLPRLPPSTFLAVNVSCRTAESEALLDALDSVEANRIVVEITEHEEVLNYERLGGALQRVRDRGARVAIDDAGAGFASLRHILLINPEIIKIDVSLTRGIDSDPGRRALAAALISFADQMGMTVIAEGIETERDHAALEALGARLGQGFLLGPPGPLYATPWNR